MVIDFFICGPQARNTHFLNGRVKTMFAGRYFPVPDLEYLGEEATIRSPTRLYKCPVYGSARPQEYPGKVHIHILGLLLKLMIKRRIFCGSLL